MRPSERESLCAAVPNEITRGAAFEEADIVFASLAEHSLDEIVRMVGAREFGLSSS